MSTDATNGLSLDVQRALQQAVGDANNAASVVKKKKREREADLTEAAASEPKAKKKKKKKQRTAEEDTTVEVTAAAAPQDAVPTSVTPPSVVPSPAQESAAAAEVPENAEASKKKRKKDKGKQRAEDSVETGALQEAQEEVPPNNDITTSSADFISAVVAAAAASAAASNAAASNATGAPPAEYPAPPFPPYPVHYLPYPPPPGYSYPPPPHLVPYGHPHPPLPMYPAHPGVPPPDLSMASSEDLLRALQEMDMSKIAAVLKSLGEAATAAQISLNIPPLFVPAPPPPGPPPIKPVAAKSNAILDHGSRQPPSIYQPRVRPILTNIPPAAPPEENNPDHAHMLANVWMNAAKLAEMVKKEGLVYKKGKFSAIEEAQLTAAIENYRASRGLTKDQLTDLIFQRDKGREAFWSEITSALHLRPIIAVYHHVRRKYHPCREMGKWTPSEDENLIDAVAQLGQQWEKVSDMVGRMSSDCRDRWRNHLQNREVRQTGPWTKEEEEELSRIVKEMTVERGKDINNDIFWGVVSQRMGGRRGRQQCRIKWTDSLSTQLKNDGQKPRWSQLDAYILVHKVDSLNVRDDSEIDWKTLPDEHWNIWSAHALQRRWFTMKRGIKGFEDMSHAEIMDILRTKKAELPPPPSAARKKKNKVTSAEAIDDSDEDGAETPRPQAGSSTAPGTTSATRAS